MVMPSTKHLVCYFYSRHPPIHYPLHHTHTIQFSLLFLFLHCSPSFSSMNHNFASCTNVIVIGWATKTLKADNPIVSYKMKGMLFVEISAYLDHDTTGPPIS